MAKNRQEVLKNELNRREELILQAIERQGVSAVSEIRTAILSSAGKVSLVTIKRDLHKLFAVGYVLSQGKGRGVKYVLSPRYQLLRTIDSEKYFKTETDSRAGLASFNFSIFSILKGIFDADEIKHLFELNNEYQNNKKKLSRSIIAQEMQRLIIELSWKSSQIEGNTYSLLETENLIKERKEAHGHKKFEAVMILNHKRAFDHILKDLKSLKKITPAKIDDVHYLLTKDLNIVRGLRKSPVGITGTLYKPLANQFQIREAVGDLCEIVNGEKNALAKSLLLMILIAYIQPFEDGNKRTGRLLGNAILLANQFCPLSYRSVDEVEYKKAVILFYEQNNLSYFKKLFIEQFEFAVKNYFRSSIG